MAISLQEFNMSRTWIVDFGFEFVKYGDSTRSEPQVCRTRVAKNLKESELVSVDDSAGSWCLDEWRNWDDWESMCNHIFETNDTSNVSRWMFPLREMYSFCQRERLAQIMFETYNVSELSIPYSTPLPLYAIGKRTGVSIDLGGHVTEVSAICDGCTINSVHRIFGGKNITEYLLRKSNESNFMKDPTSISKEYFRVLKEHSALIVNDINEIQNSSFIQKYQLPDGRIIQLSTERYRMGELFFNPLVDEFCADWDIRENLSEMIYNVVSKASHSTQSKLFKNICLAGGCSNIPGLAERLVYDFKKSPTNIRILAPPSREFSIWKGAVQLLSMPEYGGKFVTNTEYDEVGPKISHSSL